METLWLVVAWCGSRAFFAAWDVLADKRGWDDLVFYSGLSGFAAYFLVVGGG